MSQSPEVAPGQPSPDDEGLDFHPLARKELDNCNISYENFLQHTSVVCAENDGCDMVQVKHVKQARLAISRTSPPDNGIGAFSLLGGFCIALALAIPDTTFFWFGESDGSSWWQAAKISVGILAIFGLLFMGIAFYIALGTRKPKWLVKIRNALGRLGQRNT